jgi:hypothetical protein
MCRASAARRKLSTSAVASQMDIGKAHALKPGEFCGAARDDILGLAPRAGRQRGCSPEHSAPEHGTDAHAKR